MPILSRIKEIPRIDTYGIPLKSILICSSHLRIGLPKGLFPVGLTNQLSGLCNPKV